ncbi:MAG: hypothetical protein ACLQKK_05155 [Rhodomicrobium sp.]
MRRFAVIIAAILLPLPLLAPAHGCERHRAYPCQASDALGMLGAAILAGGASDPPIPGTTWGLSPSGRIVPVPIAASCPWHPRWRCRGR